MYLVGLDIGGTKCASILASLEEKDITFISRIEFATGGSWQSVLEKLCANALQQITNASLTIEKVSACGISCGGPLDIKKGLIMSPPNLKGWDNVPVVEFVSSRLKLKTKLANDADACALAEWRYGAGRGSENMIFLTFGTGLGAGLILNGKLYTGTSGMAGEVGHIRLEENGPVGYNKAGSFEGFCSGGGIAQLAKTKAAELLSQGKSVLFCPDGNIENITTKAVSLAADKGDKAALEILAISGKYFGKGLSILIDILNPEVIVAGSVFARAGHHLIDAMNNELKKEALQPSLKACRIVPAAIGEKIGDYGSIVTALL